ncbi:trimethyllysine dioxygenase, mitochondrial-like [Pecten maximus]|uniref:trimethyllysine dioxygenase, mitochondrial-like n=1 Tax=Pecten maximus TaxID=6579 RepID=UPI0014591841|nr:trimethyllysine dioxygenase, mitochondrial-like [Pecten maximus]
MYRVVFPLRRTVLRCSGWSGWKFQTQTPSTSNGAILVPQAPSSVIHKNVRNFHISSTNRYSEENKVYVLGCRSNNIKVSSDMISLKYGEFDMDLLFVWLRDHCRCSECYNHDTNQRNLQNRKLHSEDLPSSVEFDGLVLGITWSDGHVTSYDINWLVDNAYHSQHTDQVDKVVWDKDTIESAGLPTVHFQEYMDSDEGLRKHLYNLVKFGFSIVTEAPPVHHMGTLEVATRICFKQETQFGPDWTFTSNNERGDTAYSDLYLGAHTDNTYFTSPSGIQVFHVLEHDGEGGQTLLVDGQYCAEQLRSKHPEDFDLLTKTVVPHEYYEEKLRLRSLGTVLSVHPTTGQFLQIRYNPYDRSPMYTLPPDQQQAFYRAYENLTKEVRNQDNELWVKLKGGMVLFVDNWRAMHGRASFTGRRLVSGCYLPRDDWTSRARLMGLMNL